MLFTRLSSPIRHALIAGLVTPWLALSASAAPAQGETGSASTGKKSDVLVAELAEDESVADVEESVPLKTADREKRSKVTASARTGAGVDTPSSPARKVAPNIDLKQVAPPPEAQPATQTGQTGEPPGPEVATEDTGTAAEPEILPGEVFTLLGSDVMPGTSTRLAWTPGIQIAGLSQPTPVLVVNGVNAGPTLCLTGAIHGDELNGIEIIRQTMYDLNPEKLSGRVVGIPIVNLPGFQQGSRYLPDRRDLNRCFPGHSEGSLAGRLAHLFRTEIVERCDVGIDLHSAAQGRTNLPQIRLTPGNERLRALGDAFAAPVTLMSKVRDGSLREAASAAGVDLLLYEAGEGLRFDEFAARAGLAGILRVMAHLGMIGAKGVPRARGAPVFCERSGWTRAPSGGLLRTLKASGDFVEKGAVLGVISDPFGTVDAEVQATETGIIVGRTNLPVVNEGDALFHIAVPRRIAHAEAAAQGMGEHLEAAPLFDEDEII